MFVPWGEAKPVEMRPGLVRRTLAAGDRVMMCEFRARAGVVVDAHAHPHEQAGCLVSGEMALTIDGVERTVRPGDSYVILGGQTHSVIFGAESVIVEAFAPPRNDFRA